MEENTEELEKEIQHLLQKGKEWSQREFNLHQNLILLFFPGFTLFVITTINVLPFVPHYFFLEVIIIDGFFFLILIYYWVCYSNSGQKKKEAFTKAQTLAQHLAQIKEEKKRIEEERRRTENEKFENEQRAKGLVKFVNRLGHVKWGTTEQVREWKIIDLDMQNNFINLTPRQFEQFIAHLFQKMGYQVSLGPYVKDFGADILAKRDEDTITIQVKKYAEKNKVGAQEVQQVGGALLKYKTKRAILITTTDFTKQAKEQAHGTSIELWNHTILFELIERYIL